MDYICLSKIYKMAVIIKGFHHFAIKAQDFQATLNFYQSLHFEIVHSWSLPEFNLKQCVMMRNKYFDCYIEICDQNADFPSQGRKHQPGEEYVQNSIMHLCFTVNDAQQAYEEAIANGAKPLSGKEVLELHSQNRSVTVANSLVYSPNGEVIEFLEEAVF